MTPAAPIDTTIMSPGVDPEFARDVDSGLQRHAEHVADDGADLARSMGLDAEPVFLPDAGDIVHTLIGVAGERHAAAIVVGSRGLSGIRARLEGSTSKGLLRHAPCPVVVVHESE